MSDRDTSGSGPFGSDEDEQGVREVLRSQDPVSMPAEVAAALHATLAREASERAAAATREASVTSITDAPPRTRFRRLAPQIAAAAVVLAVLAVVVPQVVGGNDTGSDSTTSAGAGDAAEPESSDAAGASPDAASRDAAGLKASEVVRLSGTDFAGSVTRNVVDAGVVVPPTGLPTATDLSCADGQVSSPDGVAATVDGHDARLFAEATDDDVTYRAYGCTGGTPRVLGSATFTS